jgi:hypothetical protein
MPMPDNTSPQWQMEAQEILSCNCDYGCPCNFNALPTYGNCEALLAYHVTKGNFGDVSLDGVTFAWGLWWPKAIHMGEGVGKLYVDKKATPEQVKAIEQIVSGKHGGGVFSIFPSTFKTVLPTEITNIAFHFSPYEASFTVEGAGESKLEHIINAKTGANFEGEVVLPGGINYKRGQVANVDWHWNAEGFSLKHEKKHGSTSISTYTNEGCIA